MAHTIWTFTMKLAILYGAHVHVYASIIICIIGIITNIMNVIVFSHKTMVSPINIILAGMAVADLMQLIEYIPVVYYIYIGLKMSVLECILSNPLHTIGTRHVLFGWLNHGTSICLTVILFWWRHDALVNPLRVCHRRSKAVVAVVICYLLSATWALPLIYLHFQVTNHDFALAEQVGIATALFFQICLPWMSFAILTILCIRISKVMTTRKDPSTCLRVNHHQYSTKVRRSNRTKRLFWVILAMFFVTELPTSLSTILLMALYRDLLYAGIFWELNDALPLMTASLNFFIYYFMSSEFRNTFHCIFCNSSPHSKVKHPRTGSTTPIRHLSYSTTICSSGSGKAEG